MTTSGTPTRAGLWLRVSDAREGRQDVASQEAALLRWADARGFAVVRTYRVGASAWRGGQHAALAEVYEDCRRREYDVLLVFALDRLSREGVLPMLETLSRIESTGVRVMSLTESWTETTGPTRELLVSVIAWIARQESTRRSERVRAGMARLKAKGVPVGRPRVTEQVDLALVQRMRSEGASWATISRAHPSTVPTPRGGYKRPSAKTIARAWASQNGLRPEPPARG